MRSLAVDDLSGGKPLGRGAQALRAQHLNGSTPPVDPGEGERERCRRDIAPPSPLGTASRNGDVGLWRPQASGDGLRRGRPVEVREDASAGWLHFFRSRLAGVGARRARCQAQGRERAAQTAVSREAAGDERRRPVKRTAPPKRTKPISRQSAGLKRASRMKPIGKRGVSDRDQLRAVRPVVLARAGNRCERCGRAGKLDLHHRRMRSQGGTHHASNLVAICRACHEAIHAGAADAARWIVTRKGRA